MELRPQDLRDHQKGKEKRRLGAVTRGKKLGA